MKDLCKLLQQNQSHLKAIVTGGRCGIGNQVCKLLRENGITTMGTTRFPNGQNSLIKLDLKDSKSFTEIQKMLKSGQWNVLILSASETLHYPNDDQLVKDWKPNNKRKLDWTNDFERENSGIWHKTLDMLSHNEILSPLMANVVGNATLLGYFLQGVKHTRAIERLNNSKNKKFFCCIVVTSFEGTFEPKTPFHPITNACKSALEQIVWTTKEQADFLNCKILLADPGWIYTEGSFGKIKGPVPIELGARQILQPLAACIENYNNVKNASLFKRLSKINRNSEEYFTNPKTDILVKFEPCGHVVKNQKNATPFDMQHRCNVCLKWIESRSFVDYQDYDMLRQMADKRGLSEDIINLISSKASIVIPKFENNWTCKK